jgi:hypothetical protein
VPGACHRMPGPFSRSATTFLQAESTLPAPARGYPDLTAVSDIGRIVGTVQIDSQVADEFAMVFANQRRRVGEFQDFQFGMQHPASLVFESLAPGLHLRRAGLCFSQPHLSELPQMFRGMPKVEDEYRLPRHSAENIEQTVLQSFPAIAECDHALGLIDPHGLALPAELLSDFREFHQAGDET